MPWRKREACPASSRRHPGDGRRGRSSRPVGGAYSRRDPPAPATRRAGSRTPAGPSRDPFPHVMELGTENRYFPSSLLPLPFSLFPFPSLSVACVAVLKLANVVLLDQLPAQRQLVLRRLIAHDENIFARPDVALRVAMAVEAPGHHQRLTPRRERHLVHASVTGLAADPLVDVDAVIEVDEIGHEVDPRPLNRNVRRIAIADWRQHRAVLPDLRVAGHAGMDRRDVRE